MDEQVVQPEAPADTPTYKDDDLVYVDPDTRTVVGFVEWTVTGKSKPLQMKQFSAVEAEDPVVDAKSDKPVPADKGKMRRPMRVRYYPWGTYRSMKRVYKIEGKIRKEESQKTLEEVIEKAIKEPFWD